MLLTQGVVPLLTFLTLHTLDRYYMYYSIVVLKNFKEFGQFRLNLPIKISYLIFLILKFLIQGFKSYGPNFFFFLIISNKKIFVSYFPKHLQLGVNDIVVIDTIIDLMKIILINQIILDRGKIGF